MKEFKFLEKPGIRFTKNDLNIALNNAFIYKNESMTIYSTDTYQVGTSNIFCIETTDRKFRFLSEPVEFFTEEQFLKIGNNPKLLLLK